MKNLLLVLFVSAFLLPSISFSQDKDVSDSAKASVEQQIKLINKKIKENNYNWEAGITSHSYKSEEEMKALCGLLVDESELPKILQKGDSLFHDFKAQKKAGLLKTLSLPNWIGSMSYIESQECGNCWAHAATGVTEGLLHNYYGSNIQIDLYEMDITDNASCGSCSGTYYLDCGLSYIYNYKVMCEPEINQFPNYDHAYYTIASYSNNTASISAIKESLESSPVLAGMAVYYDFYFYDGGIYQHVSGSLMGYHAVVIVGYNDDEEYWVCKNSWGTDWGERQDGQTDPYPEKGYFRIAYGECGIDAMGNVTATVQSSSFAKIIPNFQSFTSTMGSWWVSNEWAYVLSNVTIGSEITATVPDGAYISFRNGSSLLVNGTLTANGSSGTITFDFVERDGNGIRVNSGGTANISYANISDATNGIYFNQGSGTISHCNITGCNNGIYISSATPTIQSCTISDNQYGIKIYNSYSSSWTAENITNNYLTGNTAYGVYLYNSSPTLIGNIISNNYQGLVNW